MVVVVVWGHGRDSPPLWGGAGGGVLPRGTETLGQGHLSRLRMEEGMLAHLCPHPSSCKLWLSTDQDGDALQDRER